MAVCIAATLQVLAGMLSDWQTFGFHDWDVMTSYRYITVLSLKQYGELPWWHPWLCGGYPAFGHFEGATNLISPYLPVYLLADLQTAIRIEVLGSAGVGLCGSYLLAGQFTRSVALRTLLAVAYALNGRWALQAAVGHGWHLQYAWLPWVLLCFNSAQQRGRLHHAVYAGALLALMCFWGAIYPLPHTALALSLYALLLALFEWRWRPLVALAIAAPSAVGLAAPKLFAVVDALSRSPRLIESKETIGLRELLVMLTDPNQSYGTFPIRVPAYGWHEWGIYVGPVVVACLLLGVLFGRGPREHALKLVGLSYLLLGFGAFHRHAPWTLLHQLPLFASQHVPSRFHYPMLLLLGLVFVAWAAHHLDRQLRRHPWLDVALLLPVALVAADIARVAARPFAQAFWMEAPDRIEAAQQFHHRTHAPVNYKRRDWAPPVLLSMLANTGIIKCYGIDPDYPGIGAIAADEPGYRGLAYVEQGDGTATVTEWSPNRALVRMQGASTGALVVYNMNFDPSWRANGEFALNYRNAVATRLSDATEQIEFVYFPRTLNWSVPLFFLTLGLCVGLPSWWRRRRGRATPRGRDRRDTTPTQSAQSGPGEAPDAAASIEQQPPPATSG
jgi:hypothetical protein